VPALKRILVEPKNALVKQYQRLFEIENVESTFAEEALGTIAQKAIERKTGARGLRSIMETILLDTMFDLPGLEGVGEVVISKQVIDGTAPPLYIYAERSDRDVNTVAKRLSRSGWRRRLFTKMPTGMEASCSRRGRSYTTMIHATLGGRSCRGRASTRKCAPRCRHGSAGLA
jgi:hypothetical protein